MALSVSYWTLWKWGPIRCCLYDLVWLSMLLTNSGTRLSYQHSLLPRGRSLNFTFGRIFPKREESPASILSSQEVEVWGWSWQREASFLSSQEVKLSGTFFLVGVQVKISFRHQEWVPGASPARCRHFGTSGSSLARFLSEILQFENC